MSRIIDLRSDTVTKPSGAMLQAMSRAPVGDDVYEEDPTVNQLQEEVSALLGMEAGLFVPSGTMANQLAVHVHCRPGESIICERDAHVYLYEGGAAAALSGVQFDLLEWEDEFSDAAIENTFHPESLHSAPTRLIWIENTHNRHNGRVLGMSTLQRVLRQARQMQLYVHCDGARLWNAAAALNVSEKSLVEGFDSVAVCFSKGLGAPVGSMLCGSKPFIAAARRFRKRWGGGMRQAGVLAAAAAYALKHNRERLITDHEHARQLAAGLREIFGPRIVVRYPDPGTNICYAKWQDSAGDVMQARLREQGILANHTGRNWLRFVTHLDFSRDDMATALEVFKSLAV